MMDMLLYALAARRIFMKKIMVLAVALIIIVSTTSCGQQSNSGFKTKLPTFTEAYINNAGSEWTIQVESYEINGDMIYIHGSQGINVLVSLSNCILVDSSGFISAYNANQKQKESSATQTSLPEISVDSTPLPSEEVATATRG